MLAPQSIKVVRKVTLTDGSEAEMPWLVGLRDRALIGVMVYTFARIGAVVAIRVEDYFPNGKRWWVRLQEKGGKRHEMPAHHKLEQFLDEYVAAAGIRGHDKTPLFRSANRRSGLGRPYRWPVRQSRPRVPRRSRPRSRAARRHRLTSGRSSTGAGIRLGRRS